jgi:hypothetical protein
VLRAIARDRERRYQRGRDLARELRAAIGVASPTAAKPQQRTRWLAIAAVLLALAGAGVLAARQWSKPATGYVVTTSDPVGAEVVVDGKVLGQTPNSFEVPEGTHEIEYRKEGYFTAQATINVPARARVTVPLDLVPETEERP